MLPADTRIDWEEAHSGLARARAALDVGRWREGWQPPATLARWRFNSVQLVLAAFTFFTILTLVFSGIRNGLLAQPEWPDRWLSGGPRWCDSGAHRLAWNGSEPT